MQYVLGRLVFNAIFELELLNCIAIRHDTWSGNTKEGETTQVVTCTLDIHPIGVVVTTKKRPDIFGFFLGRCDDLNQ